MDKALYIEVLQGKHKGLRGYVLRADRKKLKCKTFVDGCEFKFDVKVGEIRYLGV